jgi:drug/metabolite transporter (DMT)-like permease
LDLFTIVLMLLAGVLHAGWHSLVKSGADQTVNLAGMGIVASAGALIAIPFVPLPPAEVWPVLAFSVALHVGYKLCVASAYARADLGEAFPLARGAVPLFATAIAFVTLGQVPSAGQCAGIFLVSAGLLLLAIERLRGDFNGVLLAATAGAALAVAGYSVVDAYGTRLAGNWISFTAWLIVVDNAAFLLLSRAVRGAGLWPALLAMKGRIVASGVLGLVSFSVFLWALSRNPVGPVSALRETSVLFAIMIGVLLHREAFSAGRLGAGCLIVTGIVVIAIWR